MRSNRPISLAIPAFCGWTANCSGFCPEGLDSVGSVLAWTDGICSVSRFESTGGAAKFYYRYEGLVEALVDFLTQKIELWPLDADCTQATLDHFLADVLLPGILDHQGALVLHSGAVIIEGSAALLVGGSGRGKSTLTASFYADGYTVLSDDGIIVTGSDTGARVEAVYPGIRLLPGTLSDLFADPVQTTEVAHYAAKRRIVPDARMSAASFPAAALFFLAESSGTDSPSICLMGAADACIGLVSQSFALDPSDTLRARSRIEQAARLTAALPVFALDYPRDFASLPQVRQAIVAALGGGHATGLQCQDQVSG